MWWTAEVTEHKIETAGEDGEEKSEAYEAVDSVGDTNDGMQQSDW